MKFYLQLAFKDVFRLWSATQLQVIIVAGICLPILMLLGLKNGHVANLRQELIRSPTGRQIMFWSAQRGPLIDEGVVADIHSKVANCDIIIPEGQRLVFLLPEGRQKDEANLPTVTIYSTLSGDPLLNQFDVDIAPTVDSQGSPAEPLILSSAVADNYDCNAGEKLDLVLRRQNGTTTQSIIVPFTIVGIMPESSKTDSNIGYVSVDCMKRVESFSQGDSVEAWGVKASESVAAQEAYDTYLLICFADAALTAEDHEFLKDRKLTVDADTATDFDSMLGSFKSSSAKVLKLYKLRLQGTAPGDEITAIKDTPVQLAANTSPLDDFAIRWAEPLEVTLNGTPYRLVGMTLPDTRQRGGWIQNHLLDAAPWYTYRQTVETPLNIKVSDDAFATLGPVADLELPKGKIAKLNISRINEPREESPSSTNNSDQGNAAQPNIATENPTAQKPESLKKGNAEEGDSVATLAVPTSLLSFINQMRKSKIDFDETSQKFIPPKYPIRFNRARMYTDTIDDVPNAASQLSEMQFAVLSEVSRIAEIQKQGQSLHILVIVVSLGVFIFGVITVFSVLVDSTDRKKGTIGIFRVMGVSQNGVFFILLIRALIIGLLAAATCSALGLVLTEVLSSELHSSFNIGWLPTVDLLLGINDYLIVAMGAMLCAAFGVLLPAIRASRLDPFDAIMEGQFH